MLNLELLTETERKVYDMLLENNKKSSKCMSEILDIPLNQIKNIQNSMYKKLGILSKNEIGRNKESKRKYTLKEQSEIKCKGAMGRYHYLRRLGYSAGEAQFNMSAKKFRECIEEYKKEHNVELVELIENMI